MIYMAVSLLLASVGLFFYLWYHLSDQIAKSDDPQRPPVWATRDLPAFHVLTDPDLKVRAETAGSQSTGTETVQTRENFVGKRLASDIKKEDELTTKSLLSDEVVEELFADTVEVAIPANSSTMLSGRLKVGDVMDLAWLPAAKSAPEGAAAKECAPGVPNCIENLVVVGIPAGNVPAAAAPPAQSEKPNEAAAPAGQPGAVIVVAIKRDKLTDLAAALGSAKWVLARNIHISRYTNVNIQKAAPSNVRKHTP